VVVSTNTGVPARVRDAVHFYAACVYVDQVYVVGAEPGSPLTALQASGSARKTPTVRASL
jgi:hypothetical protein